MKRATYQILSLVLTALVLSLPAMAQFDDVYYDPDDYDSYNSSTTTYYEDDTYDENYNDSYYDDESYSYYDDYDYYYTSRIRRFHRPYTGFGFYSPAYVDLYYYDPFAFNYNYWYPGTSIYISFGNSWGRWNRWNNWGYYSPFYRPYAYNSWYRPFYGNGWYDYGYYGGNFYTYNNYYYGGYCPTPVGNVYNPGGGSYYGNHNGYTYGPRTTGTTKSSPRGLSEVKSVRDVNKDGNVNGAVADHTQVGVRSEGENPKRTQGVTPTNGGVVKQRDTDKYVPATGPKRVPEDTKTAGNGVRSNVPTARQPETREVPVRRNTAPQYDRSRIQREATPRYTPPRTNDNSRSYDTRSRTQDRQRYSPSGNDRSRTPDRSYDNNTRTNRTTPRSYDNNRSNRTTPRSYDNGSSRSSNRSYDSGRSSGGGSSSRSYNNNSGSSSRSSSGSSRSSGGSPSRSGRGG